MGILAAVMGGIGDAGQKVAAKYGDYLERSTLQEEANAAQALRDKTLNEMQKARDIEQHGYRKAEAKYSNDLSNEGAAKVADQIKAANAPKMVEDGMGGGMMQAPTAAEQRENTYQAMINSRDKGMIAQAMSMKEHQLTREHQTEQTDRQIGSHEKIAANALRSHEKLQRISIGIQAGHLDIAKKSAEIQNAVGNIKLDNEKEVQKLRTEWRAAKTPEDRSRISENISILTGKDSDKFLPVPLKDEQGNITGYQIFDTKNGRFVDQNKGASPSVEDIAGLKARAGNPAAIQVFEKRYGAGSAAKYMGDKPAASGAMFKDPITSEEITAAEWKRKYGEPPRRAETEMRPS